MKIFLNNAKICMNTKKCLIKPEIINQWIRIQILNKIGGSAKLAA